MANDPAFLFYPGDYLRDTQCLSERSQVAYDRIMCEHMRNICISQAQLDFFTKRLTDDEKSELLMVLKPVAGGFHIPWVTDSITKRREYSESRRKNREGRDEKTTKNISRSYDSHMEIENENENKLIVEKELFSDEIFMEQLKRDHPGKDYRKAFGECWLYHTQKGTVLHSWEWRQKLGTWLIRFEDKKQTKNFAKIH